MADKKVYAKLTFNSAGHCSCQPHVLIPVTHFAQLFTVLNITQLDEAVGKACQIVSYEKTYDIIDYVGLNAVMHVMSRDDIIASKSVMSENGELRINNAVILSAEIEKLPDLGAYLDVVLEVGYAMHPAMQLTVMTDELTRMMDIFRVQKLKQLKGKPCRIAINPARERDCLDIANVLGEHCWLRQPC